MTTSSAETPAGGLDQTANLLGALSLVIADRMADAMAEAGGRPESAAAALSALLHFLDRPTVDLLRQVLGLTSSGTVRLVNRMAESGYVQRGPGGDGRSTSVSLHRAGRAAAERVAAARAGVLQEALAGLSPAERETLRRADGEDAGRADPRARARCAGCPAVRHRRVPRQQRAAARSATRSASATACTAAAGSPLARARGGRHVRPRQRWVPARPEPVRAGSAVGYAAPDDLERLTRLAMRDVHRVQMQLPPSRQAFAQVGLGEEVHRLAPLLGHIVRLKLARGLPARAQRPPAPVQSPRQTDRPP